jgi:hypothetical protein
MGVEFLRGARPKYEDDIMSQIAAVQQGQWRAHA